jgi:hypothetical protein
VVQHVVRRTTNEHLETKKEEKWFVSLRVAAAPTCMLALLLLFANEEILR